MASPRETHGPLQGDIKPWLETRLGLMGAVVYDGLTTVPGASDQDSADRMPSELIGSRRNTHLAPP